VAYSCEQHTQAILIKRAAWQGARRIGSEKGRRHRDGKPYLYRRRPETYRHLLERKNDRGQGPPQLCTNILSQVSEGAVSAALRGRGQGVAFARAAVAPVRLMAFAMRQRRPPFERERGPFAPSADFGMPSPGWPGSGRTGNAWTPESTRKGRGPRRDARFHNSVGRGGTSPLFERSGANGHQAPPSPLPSSYVHASQQAWLELDAVGLNGGEGTAMGDSPAVMPPLPKETSPFTMPPLPPDPGTPDVQLMPPLPAELPFDSLGERGLLPQMSHHQQPASPLPTGFSHPEVRPDMPLPGWMPGLPPLPDENASNEPETVSPPVDDESCWSWRVFVPLSHTWGGSHADKYALAAQLVAQAS
jgi:hypothetical protein